MSHYFWCSEWVVDPLWSSIINFFIVFPSRKHCVCSLFHQELQDDDILSFLHLLTDTLLYKEKIPLDNYQFSQGTVDIRKAQYIFDSFFLFISFRKKWVGLLSSSKCHQQVLPPPTGEGIIMNSWILNLGRYEVSSNCRFCLF